MDRKMNKTLKLLLFFLSLQLFNLFLCELDLKPQKRTEYYKLYKSINHRICDESTVDGKLNYNQNTLHLFDKCSQMEPKMKLSNNTNTYIYTICQQIYYENYTQNEILWQTRCHWNLDKNEPYYECVNRKSDGQMGSNDEEMDIDIEQSLKMLNCFKSALNVSLNATTDWEVLGNYSLNRFELSKQFKYNRELLCDKSLRNESYESGIGNETQKVDQYFQCFNVLSTDCLDKINANENNSQKLTDYYNKTLDEIFCNIYEHRFDLTVEALIQKCQKSRQIKVKEFYGSSGADKLRDVLDCQLKALQLNDREMDEYKRKVDFIEFLYENYF